VPIQWFKEGAAFFLGEILGGGIGKKGEEGEKNAKNKDEG
jgi:hypothetical protein